MSKSIKSITGGLNPKSDFSSDYNLIDYYKNLDTSNVDRSYDLMAQQGYNLAQSLASRPDYTYSVDVSDAARQRAENATYQAYVDKLTPQFQRQTSDLETRLANQGLSVGSEAYQRAMGDLRDKQNEAYNNAAYQSVLNGQNTYSQNVSDAIKSAEFSNSARQLPLNEINALLANSLSNYDVMLNNYALEKGIATQRSLDKQQGFNNWMKLIETAGSVAKPTK